MSSSPTSIFSGSPSRRSRARRDIPSEGGVPPIRAQAENDGVLARRSNRRNRARRHEVGGITKLIEEDEDIGVLVLGASKDPSGPGPLVSNSCRRQAGGHLSGAHHRGVDLGKARSSYYRSLDWRPDRLRCLAAGQRATSAIATKSRRGPENQVPFTVGVIVLCAKMAKADGSVTTDEVKAFKEAFNVSAAEMKQAARIFNLAKQDVTGYEPCAEQLVTVFKGNRKLLEDVLEGLFHVAKADEEVHPQEEQFLGQVAKLFGFTDTEFSYIKARHVTAAKRNPYDVLGCLDFAVAGAKYGLE